MRGVQASRSVWWQLVRKRPQRPSHCEMHKQICPPCRALRCLGARAIIIDLVWWKRSFGFASDCFDDGLGMEIHAEPEVLAHITGQADSEFDFFRVGGGTVARRLGGSGDVGRVAVGNEGAVGGDGGDDVVDYPGGVLDGTGGGNGLEAAGERIGEEVPSLLKR